MLAGTKQVLVSCIFFSCEQLRAGEEICKETIGLRVALSLSLVFVRHLKNMCRF